jgi:hypothetical protein
VKVKDAGESRSSTLTLIHGEPVSAVTAPGGTSRGRMLRRGEVPEILGTSVSTLRRLEQNVLPPVVENGVHLQSEQRLAARFGRYFSSVLLRGRPRRVRRGVACGECSAAGRVHVDGETRSASDPRDFLLRAALFVAAVSSTQR